MLYCGVILATLSLAQGFSPKAPAEQERWPSDALNTPSAETTPSTLPDVIPSVDDSDGDEVMGICLFGKLPSMSCVAKCFWRGRTAHCDEEYNCRCGLDSQEQDEVDKEVEDEQDEDFFFIPRAPELITTPRPSTDEDDGVVGICIFGRLPSPPCLFRCSVKGETPACDEDGNCVCRPRDWSDFFPSTTPIAATTTLPDTDTDVEESGPPSVTVFVFDLGRLFEAEDDDEREVEYEDAGVSRSTSSCHAWTATHVIATAVLLLGAALVLLELAFCCRRRCRGHPCTQPVLAPELEKGVIKQ